MHQIEYAIGGVVEVETASAHYLLPPQQAAWIPAGLEHQATMNPDVRTVAVMFDRELVTDGGDRARILAVSPLIREMMIYALRWPIDRAEGDAVSDAFFRTLANLVAEALDHEAPLQPADVRQPDRGGGDGLHEGAPGRGDRRRGQPGGRRSRRGLCDGCFRTRSGCPWRTYLLARANAAERWRCWPRPGSPVQETATAVGFDSLSSFTRAFTQFCGQTPVGIPEKGWRRRDLIDADPPDSARKQVTRRVSGKLRLTKSQQSPVHPRRPNRLRQEYTTRAIEKC
mgnify:CR=1 FL=1